MNLCRSDFRNAGLCVALCTTVLLATWPFSPLPFNDDFTWAETVRQLQLTGHLKYNGWSSPPVIAQAYWGLAWVKLFGFSFNVLRLSCLPMAAGAIAMCYLLARSVGLTASTAVFITLTLGFSPLFMPLACTFMTDVPGLFFALLSMYALLLGLETVTAGPAICWIVAGAILGLIGGSSRQVVWIVPLVVLPYTAWLRRREIPVALSALGSFVVVFAGAMATQRWFALQEYSVPDPPGKAYLHAILQHPGHLAKGMLFICLTTALLLLPVGVALFRRWSIWLLLAALIVVVHRFEPALVSRHFLLPWMGNIISVTGVMGSIALAGDRPVMIPLWARDAVSVLVISMVALLATIALRELLKAAASPAISLWNYFIKVTPSAAGTPALLLTSMALLGLEMTRAVFDVAFDRHLLPLIPLLGIPLLMLFQNQGRRRLPIAAWIVLAIFTIGAAGLTQEVNALARARATAIARLESRGVRDYQVDAGFENAYWVQVERGGHVNDARLRNPPDAYDARRGPTPQMHVVYRLESEKAQDTEHTDFGSVDYFGMLPHFTGGFSSTDSPTRGGTIRQNQRIGRSKNNCCRRRCWNNTGRKIRMTKFE